ncbi:MAG: NAD-dependent dehydratase, partial [Leadbetterella sp.]|nr:NAD-dependent dehydratase [Leadbetterella sp.]
HRGLQALIARSADFYGPGAKNGALNILVLDDLAAGKKPKWQSDARKVHSFTYTPDAARAVALLGNTDAAYHQVWHLPTSPERLTGEDFIRLAASLKGAKNSYTLLTPFLLWLAGFFSRTVRELGEMQYQNDRGLFFRQQQVLQSVRVYAYPL